MYESGVKQNLPSVVSGILMNIRGKQYNPYLCILISTLISFPIGSSDRVKLIIIICKAVDMVSINARIHALTDLFYFLFRDQTILTDKRSRRRKFITYANYLTVNKSFRYFSKNLKILESQKKQKENMFYKKMTLKWKIFYNCIKY